MKMVHMNKFKVGDIIIGNSLNNYNITNKSVKCEVLRINGDDDILVKVFNDYTLNAYPVRSSRFDLFKSALSNITINEDGSYEQI